MTHRWKLYIPIASHYERVIQENLLNSDIGQCIGNHDFVILGILGSLILVGGTKRFDTWLHGDFLWRSLAFWLLHVLIISVFRFVLVY